MKNYLSLNERNTWLSSMVLVMYNENVLKVWEKNLTKDELRKLKTSITMTKNALKSVLDRMPNNERKRIVKHSEDFDVKICSKLAGKIMQDNAHNENQKVEMDRTDFEKLTNELMVMKCANCKTNCNKCRTYELFITTLIPRFDLEDNCPFAFKTIEHKKNSRKEKKTKNRYDDLEDEIEYNFKIKGRGRK